MATFAARLRSHRRRLALGALLAALALGPAVGQATGLIQPCRDGMCRITTLPRPAAP